MNVATLGRGRYRVDRVLGSGGMAVVHLAHDDELDRPVAVKVLAEHLAEDEDFRRRFEREARIAARLSHPNVVAVLDAGVEGDRPYIVMEFVRGENLAHLLARRGRLTVAETLDVGSQIAAGLGHAHSRGLVHRDVKPHNVLLGDDGVVKIADFGIARPTAGTQRLTEAGTVLGTAAYLAPEQALGDEVTAAADVYSLGAVLYESLAGRPPLVAESLVQLVIAHQQEAIVPLRERAPETPPELEDVVMRCLARNPAYRPASAAEVAQLLSGSGSEAATTPLHRPQRTSRPTKWACVHTPTHMGTHAHALARRGAVAVVGLLAAAAVAAGAVMATTGGRSAPPPLPTDRHGQPALQARELAGWLRRVSR